MERAGLVKVKVKQFVYMKFLDSMIRVKGYK